MAAERMERKVAQQVAAHLINAGVYFEAIPLDAGQVMLQVHESRAALLATAVTRVAERLARTDN